MNRFLSTSLTDLSDPMGTSSAGIGEIFRDVLTKDPRMPCRLEVENISNFAVLFMKITPFIGPKGSFSIVVNSAYERILQLTVYGRAPHAVYLESDLCKKTISLEKSPFSPNNHHRITVKPKDKRLEVTVNDDLLASLPLSIAMHSIRSIEVMGDVNVKEISTAQSRRRRSRNIFKDLLNRK